MTIAPRWCHRDCQTLLKFSGFGLYKSRYINLAYASGSGERCGGIRRKD